MEEPTEAERDAFRTRMIRQLGAVAALFSAAVQLHRCYDRNATTLQLGRYLSDQETAELKKAGIRWTKTRRAARHLRKPAGARKTTPSAT